MEEKHTNMSYNDILNGIGQAYIILGRIHVLGEDAGALAQVRQGLLAINNDLNKKFKETVPEQVPSNNGVSAGAVS